MKKKRRRRSSKSTGRRLPNATLFFGSLLLLLVTQLSFGGIYQNAHCLIFIGCAVLLGIHALLLAAETFRNKDVTPEPFLGTIPTSLAVCIGCFLAIPLLQLIPLPGGLVRWISPPTFEAWERLVEFSIIDKLGLIPSSFDTYRSVEDFFKYLPAVFLFWAGMKTIRTRTSITVFCWVMTFFALFQAFYGAYQTFSTNQQIWYWTSTLYRGFVTGTYVNRSHLAGFFELTIPLAVVCALQFKHVYNRNAASNPAYKPTAIDWLLSHSLFIVPFILAGTLVMTGSRGGIMALLFSAMGMFAVSALRRGKAQNIKLMLAAGVAVGIIVILMNTGAALSRFGEADSDLTTRLRISQSVLPMIFDAPLGGIGLGNFNEVYSAYSLPEFAGVNKLFYAHNDWFQIAAELGVPGLGLAVAIFIMLLSSLTAQPNMPRETNQFRLALVCGFVSISIHNLVDFNFHVPANLFVYAFAAGAALNIRLRRKSQPESTATPSPIHRWAPAALCGALFLVALPTFGPQINTAKADTAYRLNNTAVKTNTKTYANLIRSIELTPENPNRLRERGAKRLFAKLNSSVLSNTAIANAHDDVIAAITRQPGNEENWYYLLISDLKHSQLYPKRYYDYAELISLYAPNDQRVLFALSTIGFQLSDKEHSQPVKELIFTKAYMLLKESLLNSIDIKDRKEWIVRTGYLSTLNITQMQKDELLNCTTNMWLKSQIRRIY